MTFKLREPICENQFLQHDPDSASDTPILAGTLVYLVGDKLVDKMTDVTTQTPVGFLMQKVKAEYTDLPSYARFRSDQGSSDAFVGDPVAVAHGYGAVYETDQYVDESADGIAAGTLLYPDNDGKLSDSNADSATTYAAVALATLTADQCTAGAMLLIKGLI